MKTNYLELFFGKFKHSPVLCLKIFQWSHWCLKFILSWATAILHKAAVNFLSEISDYFSLSLPLFKLLRTRLPLPSPPPAPSSGTFHLHSHCGSGNRGMAPPGKSSLTTTTVLSICLTVCCVLRTSNHAQIETVPPENKCWMKRYASRLLPHLRETLGDGRKTRIMRILRASLLEEGLN